MPTPDPLIEYLRSKVGSRVSSEVHDYLAAHPEEAYALRIRFGIKTSADPDEDSVRQLARLICKRKRGR
jgi:hypothetical protein